MMLKEIRWHGRGGQGSFTGARLLGTAASLHDGRFAQAFPSFGPERRGAPVLGFNRISDKKITDRSEIGKCDFIIFLDETLWTPRYGEDLKDGGLILINTAETSLETDRIRTIDATGMALEILGLPIANTAMLGALSALSGETVTYGALENALRSSLKASVLEKNLILLEKAYERF